MTIRYTLRSMVGPSRESQRAVLLFLLAVTRDEVGDRVEGRWLKDRFARSQTILRKGALPASLVLPPSKQKTRDKAGGPARRHGFSRPPRGGLSSAMSWNST